MHFKGIKNNANKSFSEKLNIADLVKKKTEYHQPTTEKKEAKEQMHHIKNGETLTSDLKPSLTPNRNKASWPKIPIFMLSMVSTTIHTTLIAKKNKAGEDFKFTALLEKIQRTALLKFHKMMADIYEEVQHFHHDTVGAYDQDTNLALLDLNSMDNK
ncbi:hypothetical protein BDR04DRAFT_1118266 [Suillus decipiens]|nr:hypothetical protein BDR04DRAFT_1118266 [Suillus decipiens]